MLSRSHSPSASHCPGPGTLFPLSLQQEGELIWNHATLHGWLHDYAGLQRLLLLRAEMLSRAPSRGTELTAMTYHNIQTRSICNLLTFGQHVTLLPQYSKTTGHEKPVPPPSRPLSSLANCVAPAYSLVITRPFSQLAAKICFRDESIVRLYKDLLFVNFNKKFTEDLSAVMANYSLPLIQFGLTINPWRHIQTVWKRKSKCTTEDSMEMDQEEDVHALRAGHSWSTENRIYGLSTQSHAGAAEAVLPLFLQARTAWQEHCQVMPGGIGLSYHCPCPCVQKTRSSAQKPCCSCI